MARMRGLRDEVKRLHNEGKTQKEIALLLKCSIATACYHLNDNFRKRHNEKNRLRSRATLTLLHGKLLNFKNKRYVLKLVKDIVNKNLTQKLYQFNKTKGEKMTNLEQLIKKIGDKPTCYLSGRSIDLEDSKSYHLDHIHPLSRGGDNSIDNCDIACRSANQSKHDMTVEEYLRLCQEVLENFGYNVQPPTVEG